MKARKGCDIFFQYLVEKFIKFKRTKQEVSHVTCKK